MLTISITDFYLLTRVPKGVESEERIEVMQWFIQKVWQWHMQK